MLLKLKEANIEIKKANIAKKKKSTVVLKNSPGGRQTSWLFTSINEDLNYRVYREKKISTVLLNVKITLASEICASIPHENLEWNGYVL